MLPFVIDDCRDHTHFMISPLSYGQNDDNDYDEANAKSDAAEY
jgi:hypothetical protein